METLELKQPANSIEVALTSKGWNRGIKCRGDDVKEIKARVLDWKQFLEENFANSNGSTDSDS